MFSAVRIEDGLGVDLVRAERERLHGPAEGLRLANRGERSERCVQRWNAAPVEASAMAARALSGQGSPGPLRIVCSVDQSPEVHRACGDSGVAAGRNPVEICMDMIGAAFTQQPIRRGAAEARQGLGAEPGVGGER